MPIPDSETRKGFEVACRKVNVDGINELDEKKETNVCRELIFYVNGQRVVANDGDTRTTLATYLRENLRLTGTKIGCNEGGCGACTVMLSDIDPEDGLIRHYSVNACLTPLCSVFGKAVTTTEGVGNTKKLHAVQERLAKGHGSQCGFCTPGFVMAMYALLRNNPNPCVAEINEAIQGNLCRCTGYRPILDAMYSFSKDGPGCRQCDMSKQCCKYKLDFDRTKQIYKLSCFGDCQKYEPANDLKFPPELKMENFVRQSLAYHHEGRSWYQPTTLRELLALWKVYPQARLVAGNTEVGVEQKFQFIESQIVICVKQVREFRRTYVDDSKGVYIGMGLSLTEVSRVLARYIRKLPEWKCGVFRAVKEMLKKFAGIHIRNVATIAGNIVTASPISDLNPIWMTCGATIVVRSVSSGERCIVIDEKFFTGYRKTVLRSDEVICGIWIPFTEQNEQFIAYKQAQRREDDIAIVTGAFAVRIDSSLRKISDIHIAFGGIAPVTKMAIQTQQKMLGRAWDDNLLNCSQQWLRDEFQLPAGVPGGMERYRQALVLSLFAKFFIELSIKDATLLSEVCLNDIDQKLIATQIHQDVPGAQPAIDPVGRAVVHASGVMHTTGEAAYCDDYRRPDMLHMVLVLAPVAKGTIKNIDRSAAMKLPGVVAYVDHRDVRPGAFLGFVHDTPIFADRQISYFGEPVGAVLATDHETARRAAHLVKIDCIPEKPVITTEEAIASSSYLTEKPFAVHSSLHRSDTARPPDWSTFKYIIEGSTKIGGQEHFYLETQSFIVIPNENDELEIIASTQSANDVQESVSEALNIPQHKITVRVKRIGGGFGGKESASALFVVPAAIAATKLRRPVKITLERFDDMAISGTRHPYRCDYKCAVDETGKLQRMEMNFYSNCGHSMDLSMGIMHRTLVHCDNCYKFPYADVYGRLCKTNLASNTAFRGFGGPQGMFACETMMLHIARQLRTDVNEFREKNMYEEGDYTHFGMPLRKCNIRRCWQECKNMSNFDARSEDVAEFNKKQKYIKRGIYMVPTKFGIAFGLQHLNQAGALVHIYKDGTVLVSHGGVEMGQGLHTKIIQITARCLGVAISKVYINESATDKVPNASATSASAGSDLYGLAVRDACTKLNECLKPIKRSNPNASWEEWIKSAYMQRISLSATGFATIFSQPVNFETGEGAPMFGYCVYGAACSEVEVDCLTGDHRLLRSDIVMDVGDSLNPAIDIGQIEGAFIQGYGLFTIEEIKVRPNGIRLTRGPGTYKIPTADDIPKQFHVALLKGSSNEMAIYSSKAIGEPPLFLGSSAFFAIRNAVEAYRASRNQHGYFRFDSPATPERIRMACIDSITQMIPKLSDTEKWTVEL